MRGEQGCRASVSSEKEVAVVTTVFVLLLLMAAFGVGRLFQWVRDARGVLRQQDHRMDQK
jgi:uncharacterized protein involved in outer membrane biogenesis